MEGQQAPSTGTIVHAYCPHITWPNRYLTQSLQDISILAVASASQSKVQSQTIYPISKTGQREYDYCVGGSHEGYVKWMARAVDASGWRAVVLNYRGCAGLPLTSPKCYDAVSTGDVRAAIAHIRRHVTSEPALRHALHHCIHQLTDILYMQKLPISTAVCCRLLTGSSSPDEVHCRCRFRLVCTPSTSLKYLCNTTDCFAQQTKTVKCSPCGKPLCIGGFMPHASLCYGRPISEAGWRCSHTMRRQSRGLQGLAAQLWLEYFQRNSPRTETRMGLEVLQRSVA